MTIIIQVLLSFFATFFYAIIFNASRKLLTPCGIVGAFGWIVYYLMKEAGVTESMCSFAGAFVLSIVAHCFTRYYKRPVIIFNVAGIIPLVPGGIAYDATKNLILSDYTEALSKGLEAMIISGSIAFGLILGEILFQIFMRVYRNTVHKFG